MREYDEAVLAALANARTESTFRPAFESPLTVARHRRLDAVDGLSDWETQQLEKIADWWDVPAAAMLADADNAFELVDLVTSDRQGAFQLYAANGGFMMLFTHGTTQRCAVATQHDAEVESPDQRALFYAIDRALLQHPVLQQPLAFPWWNDEVWADFPDADVAAHAARVARCGSILDGRDGEIYDTVEIGSQIWMAENLRFDCGKGAWCYGDDPARAREYGRLYDWQRARSVSPAGFRLPSEQDFRMLVEQVGGVKVAGGALKAVSGWELPNKRARDSVAFGGLASGARRPDGTYHSVHRYASFWCATALDRKTARSLNLNYTSATVDFGTGDKRDGRSVRCVRDV